MLPHSSAFAFFFLAAVSARVATGISAGAFFWDKKHGPKNTQLHSEVVRTILSVEHVETHPEKQQPAA